MLQSEAGYIDARPLTTISTKTLATHGRTIHLGQDRPIRLDNCTSVVPPIASIAAIIRRVAMCQ